MDTNNLVIIFTLFTIIHSTMCTIAPDPKIFFGERISGNLSKITWAHAVNSQDKLNKALSDDKIMMIEADVGLGTIINGTNDTMPIMTHPPDIISDLSLDVFLKHTVDNGKRGIKLDFKSIEAFNASLSILKENREKMTFPVFLNADILIGPGNSNSTPVNANEFLTGASEIFPESILSIGWTTEYVLDGILHIPVSYTPQQIKEMIDVLSDNNITQTVTYPVRAGIAVNTISLWSELLKNTTKNNSTLSIWSSEFDVVDAKKLSKLIKDIGNDKVYVDVPDKLVKNLNNSVAKNLPGLFMIISLIATNFILNIF